ncbi:hypothetical protein SAMN05444920_114231 [Nonomuraea solani]|uniref:Glycosyl hydrolases family 43 n=1 Tax=Nonomuraea solani TaxID=1144553 RepID=A0A1H6ESM5_9ACTN|nr:hypothetical protein [Nonomuraea solani]SEG99955.1 hypothetical protein SAMN05444920_114231 [Nonomuraea solani]
MFGYAPLPVFDPLAGTVVLAPEKDEEGYWAGSPGVLHDGERFWLTYRRRRPRGERAERGWWCAVAVSDDGVEFTDVWSVHKDELKTSSMERFRLTRADDGGFRLYVSYVDPADSRWRIDALAAGHPSEFDLGTAAPVLTAASTGTEGVKDPYALRAGPVTYLFASYAEPRPDLDPGAHATADVYNVGATTHPTGLATSLDDGATFTWQGRVLDVGTGWDRYQARLNSVVPIPGGAGYVGFYDGSASHEENYEERCGIAVSSDLFTWRRLSGERPWVTSPHRGGSVRYLDALLIEDRWWLYYEMTRADGAHELRVIRVPPRP